MSKAILVRKQTVPSGLIDLDDPEYSLRNETGVYQF